MTESDVTPTVTPVSHPEVRAFVADNRIEVIDDRHVAALLADRDACEQQVKSCHARELDFAARADAAEADVKHLRGIHDRMRVELDAAEAKLAQIEKVLNTDHFLQRKVNEIRHILTKGTSA